MKGEETWRFLKDALWGGGGYKGSGGVQGLWFWGVGGRGTAPGTAQISQLVSYLTFLAHKRRKMTFFEGCLVGWGGVPTGAGLVDRGVDQGPFKEGGGLALGAKGAGGPRPEAPRP